MTKKRHDVYESIRASKYFKSGEWFMSTDLASQLGHLGINSKSIALYLSNLRDEGEVEMETVQGGSYRIWRKVKPMDAHILLRRGLTNEELGISDATLGWH